MSVQEDVVDQFQVDFSEACAELARLRNRRMSKDSTGNRAAVDECYDRIDALLDLFLQARSGVRPRH